MMSPLLKFVACCRAAGYRISTSEVIDCASQLEHVDVLDEDEFRAVLRANFAKSRNEQLRFDRLYRLFFSELKGDFSEEEGLSKGVSEIIDSLREAMNGDEAYRAIVEFLSGDPYRFLDLIRQIHSESDSANLGSKFSLGPLSSKLRVLLNLNRVREEVAAAIDGNRLRYDPGMRAELSRHLADRIDSAQALLLREPRSYADDALGYRTHEKRLMELGERSFSALSARELEEVRAALDRLVRKLKDIVSRRYAASSRGVLDVKKTLRRAERYHGVPLEIVYRKRPPKKAKIVVLCDISSSVWAAARFMLNVLYSLHECFERVNSFVFVSGVREVTEAFENNDPDVAINLILKDPEFNYYVPTDYGETFRQFKLRHMDMLTKRTTLIIMGDARTNYLHPEDGILEEMRERSRRVIWLNPEPRSSWNTGDSEMYAYGKFCNEVRQCRNLNELVAFIEELVI
ncbi:MAG TPA: VWA domain-containing protein [Deltaproteobacteria bacterium]|nr:VWA domain-containing protein [Deltaproteobacteria bacterium]HOM29747.1 VWA domain-containing protein [Deltaproteobacteria bacterium]HPP80287.1 VWA domain-containing protein [Deltaproteobacteria bacterium]